MVSNSSVFLVTVNRRFLVFSLLSCILVAFAIGRIFRVLLIVSPQRRLLEQLNEHRNIRLDSRDKRMKEHVLKLPDPVLGKGKEIPKTLYTSKNFDTARSSTINSRWVVLEEQDETPEQCWEAPEKEVGVPDLMDEEGGTYVDGEAEEEHLPVGQHLLLDIRHVDSSFLSSEERLAKAMLEVVNECGLTLLSYHCHRLKTAGVSCVGVLLESHVSFHTWPSQGVIIFDLFTCGSNSLLPVISTAEKFFGVQQEVTDPKKPETVWAYKARGFGSDDKDEIASLTDLFTFPIGTMADYKKHVSSIYTIHDRRVDIYDVLRPQFQSFESYKLSLLENDSYESQNRDEFQPDRIVFVDGVLQTRLSGDAPYHESLVHPAMFAHVHPRRVLIIGGGDGAILREVFKHKSVEEVVMIEEEENVVEITKMHFPIYSNCSSLVGVPSNCFDDNRVNVIYSDLFNWFEFEFEKDQGTEEDDSEPFDVIIMDESDFIDGTYDAPGRFLKLLPDALTSQGVFVAQADEAPTIHHPAHQYSVHRNRGQFVQHLINVGFQSVREYEESHSGFENPWQHIVAFKSFQNRALWLSNEAELNIDIRLKANPTVDGSSPFLYFDSSTMQSYLYPSRGSEVVFCRRNPTPDECENDHGFDPETPNLLKTSSLKSYTTEESDNLTSFYVGLDELVHYLYVSPWSYELIDAMLEHSTYGKVRGKDLMALFELLGTEVTHNGLIEVFVDSSDQKFEQDGCTRLSNCGFGAEEAKVDFGPASTRRSDNKGGGYIYNPAAERQPRVQQLWVPLQQISKG